VHLDPSIPAVPHWLVGPVHRSCIQMCVECAFNIHCVFVLNSIDMLRMQREGITTGSRGDGRRTSEIETR